jgi:hypothetical protein
MGPEWDSWCSFDCFVGPCDYGADLNGCLTGAFYRRFYWSIGRHRGYDVGGASHLWNMVRACIIAIRLSFSAPSMALPYSL